MNDLIQITKTQMNGADVNSVNSREIYEYLEVGTEYSHWIKRAIEKYDFENGIDYLVKNDGVQKLDYIVTLDMAKELCMVSSTQKGKEVRKYFIKCEKELNKPLTLSEQIALIAQGYQDTEKRLVKLEETKRLENWQEKSLQDAKNKKVYEIAKDDKELASKLHRKVWSLFKKQFHLPRYNELPAIKYKAGLDYISNLTIADMVA